MVEDTEGNRIPNIGISMTDDSGGNGGMTDDNGVWVYHPDRELLELEVQGVMVFERYYIFAPTPGAIGKVVKVVLKDSE